MVKAAFCDLHKPQCDHLARKWHVANRLSEPLRRQVTTSQVSTSMQTKQFVFSQSTFPALLHMPNLTSSACLTGLESVIWVYIHWESSFNPIHLCREIENLCLEKNLLPTWSSQFLSPLLNHLEKFLHLHLHHHILSVVSFVEGLETTRDISNPNQFSCFPMVVQW